MSNIYGIDFTKIVKHKPRPSGHGAKWTKYGQEISVKDYVQAGRDGTEMSVIVERKGGLKNLNAFGTQDDQSDTVIDMSINLEQATRQLKVANIVKQNIAARKAAAEKAAAEKKQEQPKGENE